MVDVKSECVATERFEDEVNDWLLQETKAQNLHMWEIGSQFQTNPHKSRKSDVFQKYWHDCGSETFTDADIQHNLWVDLVGGLLGCQVGDVIGSEREAPVHDDDVFGGIREGSHFVDPGRFGAEGEGAETKRVQKRGRVSAEHLIYGGNDGLRKHGFVYEPETIKEIVDPLCRLVLVEEADFDE
jgi:hypothetical protein